MLDTDWNTRLVLVADRHAQLTASARRVGGRRRLHLHLPRLRPQLSAGKRGRLAAA